MTIAYCDMKVGCTIMIFDSYSAIVSQNSNILSPGDKLEIKAGIGAFTRSVAPEIAIYGKKYKLNEMGFVSYKTNAPQKPGVYKIPLLIKYFNQVTGKEDVIQTDIKYTVAKECDQ